MFLVWVIRRSRPPLLPKKYGLMPVVCPYALFNRKFGEVAVDLIIEDVAGKCNS